VDELENVSRAAFVAIVTTVLAATLALPLAGLYLLSWVA